MSNKRTLRRRRLQTLPRFAYAAHFDSEELQKSAKVSDWLAARAMRWPAFAARVIRSLSPSQFIEEFNRLAGVELLVGERTLRAPLVRPGMLVVFCFSVKQFLFINETRDH